MKCYYIYVLTNKRRGTLYVGMTSNLQKRVWEHKNKVVPGFTAKHDTNRLVYFEIFDDVAEALHREKRLKRWNRSWKISAIEENNPHWIDLYPYL